MESPEGSSQTWQTFLQLRRSVPYIIFLIILATRCFKRREENAWQDDRKLSELVEIVWSIFQPCLNLRYVYILQNSTSWKIKNFLLQIAEEFSKLFWTAGDRQEGEIL